jgi:2-polyprenyl-3-methyl-5-hydroxy-6-metoxy-1,4-benzoquinol methylase
LEQAVSENGSITHNFASLPNAASQSDFVKKHNVAPVQADTQGKRVGILIVAYNAVSTIAKVLQRIPADVWAQVEEVVVFDDASRDHTYELALGLKMLSGLDKLTVIKNEKNLGYGGNQKAGYSYFAAKGFDIVVLLHGDGQYAPEILSSMYAPLVAGEANAVFGSRMMSTYGGPLKGGMPLYKLVGNKILTYFENRALGLRLTEFHSGYRAYSLHALKQIDFSEMTDVFHFDTQIIIKLHHQGFKILEVPIPTYYGDEICYVDGLRYAQDVFLSVLRYQRTRRSIAIYPEYQEYFVHYPKKASRFSSYEYFARWIGRGKLVLDVGCGEGFFASELIGTGNQVVGVDLINSPAHAAEMKEFIQSDLDDGFPAALSERLKPYRFDRIMLQDILEHVRNPKQIMRDCAALLADNGQVLISIPNVANVTIRAALLFGRFEYSERGILDKTHVRFFTRASARRFIVQCGYEIVEQRATVMPIELALGLQAANPMMRIANRMLAIATSIFPSLFGYQLLYVARPHPTSKAVANSA